MDLPMDALKREAAPPPYLPTPAPLRMAPGRLSQRAGASRARAGTSLWARRAAIFAGTLALTAGGDREMYDVVDVGGVTALEWALLAFFAALFAWVAFSFMSALAGFLVTLSGAQAGIEVDTQGPPPALGLRTAMLLPTYNEDPHAVTARLQAMWESVEATGRGAHFDWFLLSDTTDPDIWIDEEAAFRRLTGACAGRLYYRRRANNFARKAGNIADWVETFGAAYDHMIILDADSLMSGDTLVRLAQAMESRPEAGLIQTAPVVVNARSLFGRLQQFAGRLYGPMVIAGNAWWQGPDGNYWGHNAIIRLAAFAEEAALPELKGRKPFGGHILSHDFIEAAFLRRAGYAVYAAPSLGGSYEEGPPSLIDFAARDRRWCQGNLQHLAILPARGLRWGSRLHLLTGIGSYLTAPMWFAFLILGLLISLQAAFVRPEYFAKGFNLFPAWPQQDPVLAAWVFAGTMGLLLLPKFMAYATLLARPAERREFGGGLRTLMGLLTEALLAALIAPSMMVFQSRAVSEILFGQDAGWQVQRRDDGAVPRAEIARKLIGPTLIGVAMALAAYSISVPLLLWMSPVVLGLLLSIPVGLLTSIRLAGPGVLATPEDLAPPEIVARAAALARAPRLVAEPALLRLRDDEDLRALHLAHLAPAPLRKGGKVDSALATARAKIEACETLDDALGWLDARETRALLGDPGLLGRALTLR
jgi:membrane glycosyltransferase